MEDTESFFEKITGTKSTTPKDPKPVTREIPIEEDNGPEVLSQKVPAKEKNFLSETEGQLVLDVYQDEDNIIVKSTLAGVKPEDVEISITNDMLSIKGVREKEEEIRDDAYYYQECYWGAFARSVILPTEVDAESIKASIKNGILTITLPKLSKIKTKTISVTGE